MTPFMLAVQAVLDGDDTAPELETALSRADSLAAATDYQVVIRSFAEQLVSEANAVLRQHGDVISLVDECGGALVFTLGYRDRGARVETVMAGRMAYGRLLIPGQVDDEPRQLATGDEIQTLVLRLLTDVPHH